MAKYRHDDERPDTLSSTRSAPARMLLGVLLQRRRPKAGAKKVCLEMQSRHCRGYSCSSWVHNTILLQQSDGDPLHRRSSCVRPTTKSTAESRSRPCSLIRLRISEMARSACPVFSKMPPSKFSPSARLPFTKRAAKTDLAIGKLEAARQQRQIRRQSAA
jgi:hypothetical protein